jgi:hypothetical protein
MSKIVQESGIEHLGTRAKAFAVYQCSAAGWNINRSAEEHSRDWQRISGVLNAKKGASIERPVKLSNNNRSLSTLGKLPSEQDVAGASLDK